MQPYTTNVRAEAERWLVIAEKLLEGRDLVGSKTFAIRARESGLEVADQILAVADTLIAGEKRINNQPDWYAILQIPGQTRDLELVAAHYQRLAILLNPHRSRLAFADHAFKLVYDAWSVLSNPSKKSLYDNEINLFSNLEAAAPSRAQEHHEQQHYHNWQQQPQPQQQAAASQSPIDNTGNERNETEECELPNNQDENSTFWTTCPYCFYMYEYPMVYVECSLRCQNCHRAFHAIKIQAPPPIVEGQEAYFTCWGFFPVGVSSSYLEKKKVGASNWTPFSPMFASPPFGNGKNMAVGNARGRKNVNARKNSAPRIYIDDDDIFVEVSESSDESDDEDWGSTRRKKKARKTRGRGSARRNIKKQQAEKGKNVEGASGDHAQSGSVMPGVTGTSTASNAETSRQAAMTRKQKEKVPKELGKLDLNVEFSNEVEEPAPGMTQATQGNNRAANGEEEGIEGIGFFEGLDEFLSSLPILNVVGDDKVKAA